MNAPLVPEPPSLDTTAIAPDIEVSVPAASAAVVSAAAVFASADDAVVSLLPDVLPQPASERLAIIAAETARILDLIDLFIYFFLSWIPLHIPDIRLT